MNFFARVGILFTAGQPWLAFSRLNTRGTGSFAAVMLAMHLLLTFATSALFFSASGVPAARSDPACNPMGIWEKAQRSVAVGFISAVLAEVPKFLLLKLKLDSRRFVYIPSDDMAGRKRQLQKWRAVDCISWICGIGYCVVSVLFCAAFVANVSQEASTQWLISNAEVVVQKVCIGSTLSRR